MLGELVPQAQTYTNYLLCGRSICAIESSMSEQEETLGDELHWKFSNTSLSRLDSL